MKRTYLLLIFALFQLYLFSGNIFSVADVFTDHMVVQRDAKVKIWGEAKNDATVYVLFNGQQKSTVSKNGKWEITLKPMSYGGPYKMEIKCGNEVKIFDDILIGDVWLAGGQSNMEFALRRVKDAEQEVNLADYPSIRYYKAPRKYYEEHSVKKETWRVCSPATAPDFAAVAYYFARNIHKELNIPIGIIQTPVGGTTAEAWMSKELLLSDKDFTPILERYDSIVDSYQPKGYEQVCIDYSRDLADYNKLSPEQRKTKVKPAEPMGPKNFRRPVGLFETMLKPVMPYTLKGFIFYQGESNTGRGVQYRKLFPAMIKEWRSCWKQGDIPFLFIQLPKFNTQTRHWAELREAQYLTSLKVKNTAMAVAFDQGNPKDIHPIVKDTVGWRLSQLALGEVYGKTIVYQGPEFKAMKKSEGGFLIEYNHVGSGLVLKDGATTVKGFMLAGADGKYHAAKAELRGDKVLVTCDAVNDPQNVRYLWMNSGDINLFNKDGFPAMPFRTDKFRLYTEDLK